MDIDKARRIKSIVDKINIIENSKLKFKQDEIRGGYIVIHRQNERDISYCLSKEEAMDLASIRLNKMTDMYNQLIDELGQLE